MRGLRGLTPLFAFFRRRTKKKNLRPTFFDEAVEVIPDGIFRWFALDNDNKKLSELGFRNNTLYEMEVRRPKK